jgi:hypothetical protein
VRYPSVPALAKAIRVDCDIRESTRFGRTIKGLSFDWACRSSGASEFDVE